MGSQMLVITNDSQAKGDALARELGLELFSYRGQTRPTYFAIGAAFDKALTMHSSNGVSGGVAGGGVSGGGGVGPDDLACGVKAGLLPTGPVVIADTWDNPGGGTAGDATWILRHCLDRDIGGVAFSTIWDPQSVQFCHTAGEGATLQLRIGGKTAPEGLSGVRSLFLNKQLILPRVVVGIHHVAGGESPPVLLLGFTMLLGVNLRPYV
jgi:microcystin degradation protein MlrC